MKSKAEKRAQAIERNAKYRNKYLAEGAEKYPNDHEKQEAYADHKQGIPKKRK